MGFILVADINYSLYLLEFSIFFGKNALNLFFFFSCQVLKIFFSNAAHRNFSRRLRFPFTSHLSKIAILFFVQRCQSHKFCPPYFEGRFVAVRFSNITLIYGRNSRVPIFFTFALVLLIRCWLERIYWWFILLQHIYS